MFGTTSNYKREPRDFKLVPADSPFFDLLPLLDERPQVPLDLTPKKHRWGFFTLLAKEKEMKRIEAGERHSWRELKWRPIGSTAPNMFRRWCSFAGKACFAMAPAIYPEGSSVLSPQEIQAKVEKFNE